MLAREMFQRLSQPQAAEPADPDTDPVEEQTDAEHDAALSDADFLKALRQDVQGVREGVVPSIVAAMRPALQDRPWSKRRKRRDKHGKAV